MNLSEKLHNAEVMTKAFAAGLPVVFPDKGDWKKFPPKPKFKIILTKKGEKKIYEKQ